MRPQNSPALTTTTRFCACIWPGTRTTKRSARMRLEDRAHWELIVPRIYELGGELPNDLPAFHDQAGCEAAKLPNPPTVVNILTLLMESERCAIRSWSAVCDMTFGKDPRTYDMAARILNEEIEHEAWF